MYTLVVIFLLLNFINVSNGQCVQINAPTVRFQSINDTWDELLHKQDLATNLYVVGQYNSTTVPVYDIFSQQYGYIMINDPITDITFIICTNPYSLLTYLPEPSSLLTVTDLTLTTGLYRLDIPSIHYLYQFDGNQMTVVDVVYTTDVIRISYDIVSTVKIIKGVYLPVCVFHYTDAYIYLSSFISDYQFVADNTNGLCVHKHRHSGELVYEYTNKLLLNDSSNNVIHQKCMIPQLVDVEMNLMNSDCSSSASSSLDLVLDLDRLVIPQNINTTDNHMSTVTTVCLNGQPSRFYIPTVMNSLVIYEDCRSITNCPNGWSNCIVHDAGICNAPNIDCFGSAKPLGYDTCVDIVDDFDYIGCGNASLNPGTYYVSNKYTDLSGDEWYHLCNQDWFTNLNTIRLCTLEEHNQLQCLNTLSRGPSCIVTTSLDDSSNSNTQSSNTVIRNTPYMYNITNLTVDDTIHIKLLPVIDTGRFQIIFTNEQIECFDVDHCNLQLILVLDIRFIWSDGNWILHQYQIETIHKIDNVWGHGHEESFTKETFPFQLNEITDVYLSTTDNAKVNITYADRYQNVSYFYSLHSNYTYTSIQGISIDGGVYIHEINLNPLGLITTPYFYNLTNLINIDNTIHIKLKLTDTSSAFLGIYIIEDDQNTACDHLQLVPLSIAMHYGRSDLTLTYHRTSWVSVKTISFSVIFDVDMDIFITLVDTFRLRINVNSSTSFLYDLRDHFSINSMKAICTIGSALVHGISILSNYASSSNNNMYYLTTTIQSTASTPYYKTIPSLSINDSVYIEVVPTDDSDYFSIVFAEKPTVCYSAVDDVYDTDYCDQNLIFALEISFINFNQLNPNSVMIFATNPIPVDPSFIFYNQTTFPFYHNQKTNITITVKNASFIETRFENSNESYLYQLQDGTDYTLLRAISVINKVSIQSVTTTAPLYLTTTTTAPLYLTTSACPPLPCPDIDCGLEGIKTDPVTRCEICECESDITTTSITTTGCPPLTCPDLDCGLDGFIKFPSGCISCLCDRDPTTSSTTTPTTTSSTTTPTTTTSTTTPSTTSSTSTTTSTTHTTSTSTTSTTTTPTTTTSSTTTPGTTSSTSTSTTPSTISSSSSSTPLNTTTFQPTTTTTNLASHRSIPKNPYLLMMICEILRRLVIFTAY